jgi:hypothetical protein
MKLLSGTPQRRWFTIIGCVLGSVTILSAHTVTRLGFHPPSWFGYGMAFGDAVCLVLIIHGLGGGHATPGG